MNKIFYCKTNYVELIMVKINMNERIMAKSRIIKIIMEKLNMVKQ